MTQEPEKDFDERNTKVKEELVRKGRKDPFQFCFVVDVDTCVCTLECV